MSLIIITKDGYQIKFDHEDVSIEERDDLLIVKDIKTGKHIGWFKNWSYWYMASDKVSRTY